MNRPEYAKGNFHDAIQQVGFVLFRHHFHTEDIIIEEVCSLFISLATSRSSIFCDSKLN